MATVGQDARYRIRRRLASGGMGEVTLAEDTILGRSVALKRLRSAGDRDALVRLRREALVGASLSHPNLVSVYDVWEEADGDLVIVMEYVEGETLRDAIASNGAMPAHRALQILAGVAAALDAVHEQGVVHRDVKPANILLGRDGRVKLADLGIAAVEDNTRITTSGEVVGTFRYMAPEQLEGGRSSPAMDVYGLAAVAFEALSGKKARGEPNPLALVHAIATQPPPDLRAQVADAPAAAAVVLQRGMSADPARRPRSASELVGRLRAAFEPETTEAEAVAAIAAAAAARPRAPIVVRPTSERGRRRPGALVWALLAMLTLVAGVVMAIVLLTNSGSGSPGKSAGRSHATSTGRSHATSTGRSHATSTARSHATSTARSQAPSTAGSQAASAAGSQAPSAAGSPGSSAPASPTPPAASATTTTGTSSPAGIVEAFYERSAHHDYAGAWALADDSMRAQLGGYASFHGQMSQVRSISFHEARTLSAAGASPATVAVQTTSALASGTENCSGTARAVRATGNGSPWVLDRISITCTPG